ncbi:MAG TPA: serine/threonine-protein kinase [Polyangiaceae bacterium]|nr:serine/threonine-protein kinase [Polyangiaceae bacterium]
MGAPIKDVDLLKLSGTLLSSPSEPGISYRLEELIGQGAHGVVFLALQRLPQGLAPVVVKLLRPRAVRELAGLAGTAINKEVAALRRLSERVPPTPFVVQFLDSGTFRLENSPLDLPWVAVEYIHGGLDGTTLRSRVERSISRTGAAFGLNRARSAIKCIAAGVTAIHEVGVVHRDVTPGNVLCCGFGETEVFKISDFGLARVSSVSTFGSVLLGTPGYCAPEQSFPDAVGVGPYSDVFGLACTIYFLLTGEPYFNAQSIPEMLVLVQSPERRSILDARGACSEIRERRALGLELDREFSRATRADPRERPQSAGELAAALLALLSQGHGASASSSPPLRHEERAAALGRNKSARDLRWTVRRSPGGVSSLSHIGWESNGHFLAVAHEGLVYWDGASFRDVPFELPWLPRVVRRSGAGRWLLAGDHGVLVDYAAGRVAQRVSAGNGVHFVAAAGRFDDIVVAAARRGPGRFELWAWLSGRFMEPLELEDIVEISACAQLTDTSWLFVGEAADGSGVVLEYRPLGHRARVLARVAGQSLRACGSALELGLALIGGARGYVATVSGDSATEAPLGSERDVSTVAIDALGRAWAAAPGELWTREGTWQLAWSEPSWSAPVVGILADVGRVVAVTADGGIIQAERLLDFQGT